MIAGTLVKPTTLSTTELLQVGPDDGKPVILLQFTDAEGLTSPMLILHFEDAEHLAHSILQGVTAERARRKVVDGDIGARTDAL